MPRREKLLRERGINRRLIVSERGDDADMSKSPVKLIISLLGLFRRIEMGRDLGVTSFYSF